MVSIVLIRSIIVNDEAEIEDGEEEELDLSTLDDDELVKQMQQQARKPDWRDAHRPAPPRGPA